MAHDELAILVDKNDKIIGYKKRSEMAPEDIYRIVVVWLEDNEGNALIHKRSMQKKAGPGRWENAAGGGVEKGESYRQAAYKELYEEIGIDDVKLTKIAVNVVKTDHGLRMCGWFKGITNKKLSEFKLEPREVVEVRWVNKNELFDWRDSNEDSFMPSSAYWRELFG